MKIIYHKNFLLRKKLMSIIFKNQCENNEIKDEELSDYYIPIVENISETSIDENSKYINETSMIHR